MVDVVVRAFDHAASIVIVVQWMAPGVVAVWAFKKRHPIMKHGKKLIGKEDVE